MKLIELNHRFLRNGVLNSDAPIDTKALVSLMKRCAEQGYDEVKVEVKLSYAAFSSSAQLQYRRTDPVTLTPQTQAQELSIEEAAAITLAAASVLAHSKGESMCDVSLSGEGMITLTHGETTQLFVDSGLIFPNGYHLLVRTPHLQNLRPHRNGGGLKPEI